MRMIHPDVDEAYHKSSLNSLYTFFSPTFSKDSEVSRALIQDTLSILAKFNVLQATRPSEAKVHIAPQRAPPSNVPANVPPPPRNAPPPAPLSSRHPGSVVSPQKPPTTVRAPHRQSFSIPPSTIPPKQSDYIEQSRPLSPSAAPVHIYDCPVPHPHISINKLS